MAMALRPSGLSVESETGADGERARDLQRAQVELFGVTHITELVVVLLLRLGQVGRVEGETDAVGHVPGQLHVETLLRRSEEHTSELQSLMRISYAFFCLK